MNGGAGEGARVGDEDGKGVGDGGRRRECGRGK